MRTSDIVLKRAFSLMDKLFEEIKEEAEHDHSTFGAICVSINQIRERCDEIEHLVKIKQHADKGGDE